MFAVVNLEMPFMNKITTEQTKLLFFTIFTALLCYGFALTNFSLSVDNEYMALPELSLNMGRWGTNLITYHIFHGHQPYFTLLLTLLLFAVSATVISKIFRLTGVNSYIFCALMITFPEIAYQFVFILQSIGIALGFLLSAVALQLFISCEYNFLNGSSLVKLTGVAFILMFVTAIYQALIIIPIVLYIIYIYLNTYQNEYSFKTELKKALYFAGTFIVGLVLYYISVKIICPPVEGGYLSGYVSGESGNLFTNFLQIWRRLLSGSSYYGNRMFALATVAGIVVFVRLVIDRKLFAIRALLLFSMFLFPFITSFFITNGYHPPRLYLTSGILFAFIITHALSHIKYEKQIIWACSIVCILNIYFVTTLYYSNYKIANHDKELAKKMATIIETKYPDFNPKEDFVFFFGGLPFEEHQYFRLQDSEIFGGSIFNWDGGNNFRIINLFRFQDIAYYNQLYDIQLRIKSVAKAKTMPEWPNNESIQKVDNVVIVKLGKEEGVK